VVSWWRANVDEAPCAGGRRPLTYCRLASGQPKLGGDPGAPRRKPMGCAKGPHTMGVRAKEREGQWPQYGECPSSPSKGYQECRRAAQSRVRPRHPRCLRRGRPGKFSAAGGDNTCHTLEVLGPGSPGPVSRAERGWAARRFSSDSARQPRRRMPRICWLLTLKGRVRHHSTGTSGLYSCVLSLDTAAHCGSCVLRVSQSAQTGHLPPPARGPGSCFSPPYPRAAERPMPCLKFRSTPQDWRRSTSPR
jgi:hypothetical protein